MEKYGTDELEKIIMFIAECGNVWEKFEKAGNYVSKAISLAPLADDFIKLFSLKYKMLPKEAGELSEGEKNYLFEALKKKYDIDDDKKEELIEDGLQVAKQIVESFESVRAYARKWKK